MLRLQHRVCLISLTLVAAACAPAPVRGSGGPTVTLVPWPSPTRTTPRSTTVPTVAATIRPGPTATPFKHIVAQNETLLGIAALYGVSLDSLMALNPGLNPFVLSIGQELLIPGPEGTPIGALIPTPTPIPLTLYPPACYRQPAGGLRCLTAIHNPTSQDLENLEVEFSLTDSSGKVVQSARVFPPLNRLVAGGTLPVAAAFPAAAVPGASVAAVVLAVIPARQVEGRYFEAHIERGTEERQEGGRSWLVAGTIEAPAEAPELNRTVILLTAFDDQDQVVGFTEWEADPALKPGETRDFALRVFSLGPEIARVALSSESYALNEPAS